MTPPEPPANPLPMPDKVPNWRMAEHWPELVTAVTDQAIESVSLLLRGLDLLIHKGRISTAEYKVLALPAERLKHIGIAAQQIVRFQSGKVRQSHEKIDLAYLLECVLQERRDELALLGITVWRKFQPMDVLIDPSLGFGLTKAMLDWSTPFGNRIDLRLERVAGEEASARLWMKTYAEQGPLPSALSEENIHWLLLRQMAATDGGIDVERSAEPDGVVLRATFRRALAAPNGDNHRAPLSEGAESLFKSVAGSHVLVVSGDEGTRQETMAIVRKLGVSVDVATDLAGARTSMAAHEPQLVVLDSQSLDEAARAQQRRDLSADRPDLAIVDIVASGSPFIGTEQSPAVARDALQQSLGSAVMFTLSKLL
jgi:hypothetical protein